MRGRITNHHLIAYSLSNISAKDTQNRLICVEVIVCYIIVVFLRHGVVNGKFMHSCNSAEELVIHCDRVIYRTSVCAVCSTPQTIGNCF